MNASITSAFAIPEKFWFRPSPVFHFVMLNTSTKRMAKNMNKMTQRLSRLTMTGRLPLYPNMLSAITYTMPTDWSLHSRLEQLVETVHPLDQLQRNACEEQLLQLLNDESAGVESYDESGEEAACRNDDIEDVPSVGTVT